MHVRSSKVGSSVRRGAYALLADTHTDRCLGRALRDKTDTLVGRSGTVRSVASYCMSEQPTERSFLVANEHNQLDLSVLDTVIVLNVKSTPASPDLNLQNIFNAQVSFSDSSSIRKDHKYEWIARARSS
ncbi:jg14988, partial [Pararge aegeria aegeria]